MKKKVIPIACLIIICLGLGIYGFYLNNTRKETKDTFYKVKYKYYINDEEVEKMPLEDEGYMFDEYDCTNDVTGKWSEKKWKFTPKKTANSTCKLFFVDREYEIELVAPEGVTISGDSILKVKKDENAEFNIALAEGVAIKEVTCTENLSAKVEKDKIIIESPNNNSTCSIVTEEAEYTVEAAVIGGKVTNSKQTVKFGQNVIFKVTPNASQVLDKVECTNNQKGQYSNGNLTVTKVSNDTKCTVTFKSNQYSVTVTSKTATVSPATKTVNANGTVSFSVKPNVDNATVVKNTCSDNASWDNDSYTVKNVTKNMSCNIEFTGSSITVE